MVNATATAAGRMRGRVAFYSVGKGWGFIEQANGPDLFVHHSALQGVDYEALEDGQSVTYERGAHDGRPCALRVRIDNDDMRGNQ